METRGWRRIGAVLLVLAGLGPTLGAEGPRLGGELSGELRLPAGEDFRFPEPRLDFDRLRLELDLEAKPSERLRVFAQGAVTARGLPGELSSPADLASADTLAPLTLELVEAYADVYSFLLPQLDLRAGRQRIAWGTAEKVSVVDNVDPLDLEDPWDYGRRLASDALRLKAYLGGLTVEAVYLPYFRPALLPEDSALLLSLPSGVSRADYGVRTPGDDAWANTTLGARLSATLGGWDLAASYLYGRQSLPAAERVTVSLDGPDLVADVELGYPRRHVAGLEAAGELFGVGLWGEAAFFWPRHNTVTDTTALGGGVEEKRAEVYAKWALGLDYTFAGGLYANLQYVHGFYSENERGALNDYLLLGLEWKLLGERLVLGPLGLALEVDDPGDPAGSWGLALNPELSFHPADAVRLTAGLRWLTGAEGTSFGGQAEASALYLKATFSF